MPRERPAAVLWFCAILLAIAGWQAVYCAVATEGKLTGLFYIGEGMHWPAEPGAYVYRGSTGYDGQLYRIIANDPFLHGRGRQLYGPRYWYRRIFIPGAAALLGAGRPAAIDVVYVALTDLILAFGGVCFVRLAAGSCPPAIAAAVYCLIPAVIASGDRMVLDGTALAMAVMAWWWYRESRFLPMLAALAAAVATRETFVFAVAGISLAYLLRRDVRRAAISAATIAPAAAWWLWVTLHTEPTLQDAQLSIPLLPQIARLFWRRVRPVGPLENLLLQSLDVVGMVCLLAAFAWFAATLVRERKLSEETALILPMACAAAFFSHPNLLREPYDFLRHASLLLAWVALRMFRVRPLYGLSYMALAGLPLLAYRAAALVR
jgi:hypothetical protein